MFCTKCGRQIVEGARFCTGCGAPVDGGSQQPGQQPGTEPMQQSVSRRPDWYALAGVGATAVVVALAIAGYQAIHRSGGSAETAAESGQEPNAAEEGVPAAEAASGMQDAGTDAAALRSEALRAKREELTASYGVFQSPQRSPAMTGDTAWFDWLQARGVWSATDMDFDGDGLDEMLVCAAEDDVPTLYLYDGEEPGEVAQTSSFLLAPYGNEWGLSPGGISDEVIAVHVVTVEGRRYIVCEDNEWTYALADGSNRDYWIMEYAENKLRYVGCLVQTGGGSAEFSFARYYFEDGIYTGSDPYYDENYGAPSLYGNYNDALTAFFDDYRIRLNRDVEDYMYCCSQSVLSVENDMTLCFALVNRTADSWDGYEGELYQSYVDFETVLVTENTWQQTPDAAAPYSEYILPDSSTRYLTRADLAGLSAEECRLARNEIYARHGRRFQDEALQSYFDSRSWYVGTTEDVTDDMLNAFELANRDLIVAYEEEQGYR